MDGPGDMTTGEHSDAPQGVVDQIGIGIIAAAQAGLLFLVVHMAKAYFTGYATKNEAGEHANLRIIEQGC